MCRRTQAGPAEFAWFRNAARFKPLNLFALGQSHVESHWATSKLGQNCLDTIRILVPDPIELEPIWHPHRYHGTGVGLLGHIPRRKRADPRIELLFGQFRSEPFTTTLPEIGHHSVENIPF
jgi:hypothetical protein